MVTRLKSILGRIPWSLLLRAFILGFGPVFLPFWIYVLAAVFLYWRSGHERLRLFSSFFLLVVLALLLSGGFGGDSGFVLGLIFSAAWFFLLGVKELFFINRSQIYVSLASLVVFMCSIVFFLKPQDFGVFPALVLYFLAVFMVFREFYLFVFPEENLLESRAGTIFLAGLSSLAILQVLWALSFLPVGFLSSAAVILLLFSNMSYMAIDYSSVAFRVGGFRGTAAIFLLAVLAVFIFSNWTLNP